MDDNELYYTLIPKVQNYFSIHNTCSKNNLNDFLTQIGLNETWSDPDIQSYMWDILTN